MKIAAARSVPRGNAIRQVKEASRAEFNQSRPTRGSSCQSVAKMRMNNKNSDSQVTGPRLRLANLGILLVYGN